MNKLLKVPFTLLLLITLFACNEEKVQESFRFK